MGTPGSCSWGCPLRGLRGGGIVTECPGGDVATGTLVSPPWTWPFGGAGGLGDTRSASLGLSLLGHMGTQGDVPKEVVPHGYSGPEGGVPNQTEVSPRCPCVDAGVPKEVSPRRCPQMDPEVPKKVSPRRCLHLVPKEMSPRGHWGPQGSVPSWTDVSPGCPYLDTDVPKWIECPQISPTGC